MQFLKVIDVISATHTISVKEFLRLLFKMVGDNVDVHKGVQDIRSDHYGMLIHMYSILALHTRVLTSSLAMIGTTGDLKSTKANSFLPTKDDVHKVKLNLTVLVSDILCTYIKCLQPLAKYAPLHIPHRCYSQMSEVSETCFLDVRLKNEACHSDMIEIMAGILVIKREKYV